MNRNIEIFNQKFKHHEIVCRCGCGAVFIPVYFKDKIGSVRQLYNKEMHPTSFVRCKKYNGEVGGSDKSFHLKGEAVDISCTSSTDRRKLIEAVILVGGLDILIYKDFLHIQMKQYPAERIVYMEGN